MSESEKAPVLNFFADAGTFQDKTSGFSNADVGSIDIDAHPVADEVSPLADPIGEAKDARARLKARISEHVTPEDKAKNLTDSAKEQAKLLGMQLVRRMLAQSGLTLLQIKRKTGIDPATVSRLATGQRDTGPELWTLLALAAATDQPLKLRVDPEE